MSSSEARREAEFTVTQHGEEGDESAPRRQFSRFRVDLDVTVSSEHNFYAGFVENMSVGGIFIATHQLKQVGEHIEFSINLSDGEEPIAGKGEVRWVRVYSESSNVPPGMGIRFDALEPESVARIERFLAERDPLFYDDE